MGLLNKSAYSDFVDSDTNKPIIRTYIFHSVNNFDIHKSTQKKEWKPNHTVNKDFFKTLNNVSAEWLKNLPVDLGDWPLDDEDLPRSFEDLGANTSMQR